MVPPWIAFPDIPPTSIAWRSGELAEVLDDLHRFISDQSDGQGAADRDLWPEPCDWHGTYRRFTDRPWS